MLRFKEVAMANPQREQSSKPGTGMSRRRVLTGMGKGALASSLVPSLLYAATPSADQESTASSGILNVHDFGAVGDGVANDTATLQAALKAASLKLLPLYVPPGRYRVLGTPQAPTLVVGYAPRLFGAGRSSVIVQSNVTAHGQPLLRGPSDARHVKIHDLSFEQVANRTEQSGNAAIHYNGGPIGEDMTVENVSIKGWEGDGIAITATCLKILHCRFEAINGHGIYGGGDDSEISGCEFVNTGRGSSTEVAAMKLQAPMRRARILNNMVRGSDRFSTDVFGLIVDGNPQYGSCEGMMIQGNTIVDIPGIAIAVSDALSGDLRTMLIAGNVVQGRDGIGPGGLITLSGGQGIIVAGNSVDASMTPGTIGIYTQAFGDSHRIEGNIIRGSLSTNPGAYAIVISRSRVIVTNNSIVAGRNGIQVGSGATNVQVRRNVVNVTGTRFDFSGAGPGLLFENP
jgi:hypothetical protein